MTYIHNKGNPSSDVWVIVNRPLPNDIDRKYIFSSGLGYVWHKMMEEVGLGENYYVTCYTPDLANPSAYRNIDGELANYQPKIIIPLDAAGTRLCPEVVKKRRSKNYNAETDSDVSKYCGSLLRSPYLKYPHYVMPLVGPFVISQMYKLRDQVLLDLCKAKHELDYAKTNGILQPLPARNLVTDFSCFDELLYVIDSFANYPRISVDIETIYPKTKSAYYGQTPGVPIVIGLAPSKDYGISFDVFRESKSETRRLWRSMDTLFRNTKIIGQNVFNFDLYFLEALGFQINYENIDDTLIRHHVLWPELPHSLQYMTRQYTREPYYKDEGKDWNGKNLQGLKRYNALDVTVTFEVYEAQEEELNERSYLK